MRRRFWSRGTATDPQAAPESGARETLAERLAEGALPPGEALRISIALAEALREVHRQGRVYGQLQPRGIALIEGAVRLIPSVPAARNPYSSPEQVAGNDPDWRSDIFSLGAVMYEMFSGRRFRGSNPSGARVEISARAAAPANAPPAVEALIRRCLERRVERRLQRVEILLAELKLHQVLGEAPLEGAPPGAASTQASPAPHRQKLSLACPMCGVRDVHRSPPRGRLEEFLAGCGASIGRCYRCYHRFLQVAGFTFERNPE